MAEYILQDKDKAAFINRMNKVLSQIGTGFGVDQSSFVDVPETEDDDKCIFIAASEVEEKVLDSLIDKNAFTYKIKKISVNEILREIRRDLGEAEYPSDPKYIPRQDKMDPADIVLSKNRTYFVIPINAPEPQYEKVQYNGRNKDTGEYDFTFGPNITGATGLTLKYTDRANKVWTDVRNSKPDTILVKDKAVADKWVAGEYNGGYKNN
jgi:hypothetical protein